MRRLPLDYAAAVMSDLAAEGTYEQVEADPHAALAAASDGTLATLIPLADGPWRWTGRGPDPFDLLIAMTSGQAEAAARHKAVRRA